MSETEKKSHDVIVSKSINLGQGETLGSFTRALSSAARAHVLKKMNIADSEGTAYVAEIFKSTVIVTAYKFKESASKDKLLAMGYERNPVTKAFTFGDTTEVERVMSFAPKKFGVTKSKEGKGFAPPSADSREVIEVSADGNPYVKTVKSQTGDTLWDSFG